MNVSFIALGTNIEPRKAHIDRALASLSDHENIQMIRKSSIYETAPVGYVDQANFLNMVIQVRTSLTSLQLLHVCQDIEKELGRERTIRFGPRTIDLDILLFNNENKDTEQLTIPHPRMHERAFVLVPLEEIAGDCVVSTFGLSIKDLVNNLSKEQIKDVMIWKPSV